MLSNVVKYKINIGVFGVIAMEFTKKKIKVRLLESPNGDFDLIGEFHDNTPKTVKTPTYLFIWIL